MKKTEAEALVAILTDLIVKNSKSEAYPHKILLTPELKVRLNNEQQRIDAQIG